VTPFIAGSISGLLAFFGAGFVYVIIDRIRGREPVANAKTPGGSYDTSIPWPILLLRVELWAFIIGTVLMSQYLSAPEHRNLLPAAGVGAIAGASYFAFIALLSRHRLAKRQRLLAAQRGEKSGAVP
jgi:hypothetical protein